jgi:hypothetical protein
MAGQHDLSTRAVLSRGAAVAATAGMAVLITCLPAAADPPPQKPIPPHPNNWGYGYGANQPSSPTSGGGGSSGSSRSSGGGSSNATNANGSAGPGVCGAWRFGIQACPQFSFPTGPPGAPGGGAPAVTPGQLAITTLRTLPIPEPDVRTAPPRGSDGLVGLPEWFWVTNWNSHTDTAVAGSVWATVTARPTSTSISPGSGQSPVTCPGPGTAYNPNITAAAQHSTCSHQYVRSSAGLPGSAYTVTVTVTWGGTWTGSGGTGGTLPPLTRSTTFARRVAEAQALTGG